MHLFQSRRPRAKSAVEIQEKRFGYFPKVFRWRGKRYDVQAVERCWNATAAFPQLCFRVRCHEGSFDLCQNVRDNTWRLVIHPA
jgi:hypothetical protein